MNLGLSYKVTAPLWAPTATVPPEFAIGAYSHVLGADWGFLNASLSGRMSKDDVVNWLEYGLGLHVEVYNPNLQVIFEGFINSIQGTLGGLRITRGPLLDVCNRASVVYTPILDATTNPPVKGASSITTISEDADSQAAYGVLEDVISAGECLDDGTNDEAGEIRDTYLSDYGQPETSHALAVGGGDVPSITLDIQGYYRLFDKWYYSNSSPSLTTLSAKLAAMMTSAAADGVFSSDATGITTNALLASAYEDGTTKATTIFDAIRSQGDVSNNRYLLGLSAGRILYYRAIPTAIGYYYNIGDQGQSVYSSSGIPVDPWDVSPGVWVQYRDLFVKRIQGTTLREDPNVQFAETVRYTAPFGLNIEGRRVSKVSQMLARQGVGI